MLLQRHPVSIAILSPWFLAMENCRSCYIPLLVYVEPDCPPLAVPRFAVRHVDGAIDVAHDSQSTLFWYQRVIAVQIWAPFHQHVSIPAYLNRVKMLT
ncbi:hypothetical protein BJV82DRAFT_610191 [Fennellomyces sp. T-0311]|nr:hypothetical protein BJV82DRAFT_610191 [Fennellomyces sp. T-0311]